MLTFLKNIFTARDNESFSLTKLIGIGGGTSMIYNFLSTSSDAFQDFGIGIGAIMAALAAKYHVEDKEAKE